MSSVLVRAEKLVGVSKRDDEFSVLAKVAEKQLGYSHAAMLVKTVDTHAKVLEQLLAAGVMPFTDESVTAYKDSSRFQANVRRRVMAWMILAAFLLLLSIPVAFRFADWTAVVLSISVFGSLTAGVGVCYTHDKGSYEWRRFNLSGYSKPVPEFALQTAIDTKKAIGGIPYSFWVEELTLEEPSSRVDPFLVLRIDEAPWRTYYLEMWNEPHFKRSYQ